MKHIVGFSGGVDSQMCLRQVRDKFGDDDVIALNSDVGGHEHPITTQFVKWYSENVFPVVTVTPLIKDLGGRGTMTDIGRQRRAEFAEDDQLTFDRLAYIAQIFPSRRRQFCTEHLKLWPLRRWILDNVTGKGFSFEQYAGVRCDESSKRAETPDRQWNDFFDCWVNYPIRCWSKMECFATLKLRGEKVNPLYEHGFGRVGCAPCVNSGKDDVREWAARFPEMLDKVRDWERNVGSTFFAPCVPGMAMNWVDDVVAWARTARGGKQPLLGFVEADANAGQCSSKYGLCE